MAKSTKAAGASFTPEELSDTDGPKIIRIHRAELGRVDECPTPDGSGSSPSSVRTKSTGAQLRSSDPQHARMTGNPSGSRGTDSDVSSTGGVGQTTKTQSLDEEEIPPYDEWTVEDLKDECRVRNLPVSGNKSELVQRLTDDDEASGE